MRLKTEAAAPASGAELMARYRSVRARLMHPPRPAPAPEVARPDPYDCDPPQPPQPPRRHWRIELFEFNEALRALFVGATDEPAIVMHRVRDVVAAHFGITITEIVGKGSTRRHAWPRQIAMYICARHTGLTSVQIGHIFGDRDHTTVLHSVHKVAARVAANPALAAEVSALTARCRGGGCA
jgi:hypothetical protein